MKNKKFAYFALKRNFLLLELLIAFSLFALCGSFLVSRPALVFRKELQILTEIECERIAENSFAEIQENFCSQFDFKNFARNKKNAHVIELEPIQLSLSPRYTVLIERRAQIWEKRSFTGKDHHSGKIIKCELTLKIPYKRFGLKMRHKKECEKHYQWRFFIKQVPLERTS